MGPRNSTPAALESILPGTEFTKMKTKSRFKTWKTENAGVVEDARMYLAVTDLI